MSGSSASRIIYHDKFDGDGFTNENSLANMLLTKPDKINPVITFLAGREDKKFPLSFLTEGQKGGTKTVEIQDVQYEWDVFRRIRKSDAVLSTTYVSTDKPGLNQTAFYITFETNWLKIQHTIVAPDGTRARIMSKPVQVGSNYVYKLRLNNPSAAAYCAFANLQAGVRWTMEGGAMVSESKSRGNESNKNAPGKMKNQISILRKSYEWGGNVANRTVEVKLALPSGTTSLYMEYERWLHTMDWKQVCEEHYWYSEYNRLPDGSIPLKDEDNGLPIPEGAGVIDQIPNTDTYGVLTLQKLKNTVGDVLYGATDTEAMTVVLYGGLGFLEDFDTAIKSDGAANSFVQALGNTQISQGSPNKNAEGYGAGDLVYGNYFGAYKHVDGYVIITKHLPLLDFGARAENAPKHPISGKPMTSHMGIFLDQSTYEGERNVRMVTQKGRSMITGVVPGMSPTGLPGLDFKGNAERPIAHDEDSCAIHFLSAKGICINRNTHCFILKCDLV